jgi:hypothetical protein
LVWVMNDIHIPCRINKRTCEVQLWRIWIPTNQTTVGALPRARWTLARLDMLPPGMAQYSRLASEAEVYILENFPRGRKKYHLREKIWKGEEKKGKM